MDIMIHFMYIIGLLGTISYACPSPLCMCEDVINCASRNLDRIPHFIAHSSKKQDYATLDLSENVIEYIPASAFEPLTIKALSLSSNPLLGISPRAFQGLENVLQRLDLFATGLQVIHWGVLRNLHLLRDLDLGHCDLFALPVGLFDGLSSLEDLSLTLNKLSSIKIGHFRNIKTLQNLNLLGNQINSIEPGSFEHLMKLQTLNLNKNLLEHINPLSFQGLHSLQNLYLEGNQLNDIPSPIFILLPTIKVINVAQNNISEILPRAFKGTADLEEIYAHGNSIHTISPEAFRDLTNLKILHMDKNRLHHFRSNCVPKGLENIKELSLRSNPIECTCDINWIQELYAKGTSIFGHCESPAVFSGIPLSSLNFTLCGPYSCP